MSCVVLSVNNKTSSLREIYVCLSMFSISMEEEARSIGSFSSILKKKKKRKKKLMVKSCIRKKK